MSGEKNCASCRHYDTRYDACVFPLPQWLMEKMRDGYTMLPHSLVSDGYGRHCATHQPREVFP